MTARERAIKALGLAGGGIGDPNDSWRIEQVATALDAHAAEAVAERDKVWRGAVQAVRESYWPAAYQLCCDHILAEVERRTKGSAT